MVCLVFVFSPNYPATMRLTSPPTHSCMYSRCQPLPLKLSSGTEENLTLYSPQTSDPLDCHKGAWPLQCRLHPLPILPQHIRPPHKRSHLNKGQVGGQVRKFNSTVSLCFLRSKPVLLVTLTAHNLKIDH